MGALLAVAVVVFVVYAAVCAVAGMARYGGSLATFRSDTATIERQFSASPPAVMEAYRQAVRRVPGMSIVEDGEHGLLLDMRPTVRVLGGVYGLAIRVGVEDGVGGGGGHTVVTVDAARKVPFAWTTAHERYAALVHAERSLRMAAKQSGVVELLR